jgi:hypothetical protein
MNVDNGPEVLVNGVYLGKGGSLVTSFYAYWEDYFDNRRDYGLKSQGFAVQLDKSKTPQVVHVTATPGQDVSVAFDKVESGTHTLTFYEVDTADSKSLQYIPLWGVELVVPADLAAPKSKDRDKRRARRNLVGLSLQPLIPRH